MHLYGNQQIVESLAGDRPLAEWLRSTSAAAEGRSIIGQLNEAIGNERLTRDLISTNDNHLTSGVLELMTGAILRSIGYGIEFDFLVDGRTPDIKATCRHGTVYAECTVLFQEARFRKMWHVLKVVSGSIERHLQAEGKNLWVHLELHYDGDHPFDRMPNSSNLVRQITNTHGERLTCQDQGWLFEFKARPIDHPVVTWGGYGTGSDTGKRLESALYEKWSKYRKLSPLMLVIAGSDQTQSLDELFINWAIFGQQVVHLARRRTGGVGPEFITRRKSKKTPIWHNERQRPEYLVSFPYCSVFHPLDMKPTLWVNPSVPVSSKLVSAWPFRKWIYSDSDDCMKEIDALVTLREAIEGWLVAL